MLKYTIQRVLLMLMTLLIITCMCFILIRMLPPQALPIGDPHTQVILERREALGYNKPYMVQFGIFLKQIITKFDWGICDVGEFFGKNAWDIFVLMLPPTILINLYSILISIPIGIMLGIIAALKKNTWIDHSISTLTMVVISVPSFVYAFLVQYFLSFKLGWFPFNVLGLEAAGGSWTTWKMFVSMMPAVLSLSFGTVAGFTRTTRAELTEVLTSEFMLLARTKGLTRSQATVRHAMKNCMVVVLPAIFGSFIGILSGSLIIEGIFNIPGVGDLYLDAINGRNYPMFMLLTVFYTSIGLVASIVVDISYGFIDPRIRMGSRK